MADAIRIDGYKQLQRDLKAIEPAARRELTKGLKTGAQLVKRRGMPYVARGITGKLAADWRAGATQKQAYIRNRVPYAGVLEFGGTIQPKGTPFTIRAQPSMTRALEDNTDQIVDMIGDALEAVAARHSWR